MKGTGEDSPVDRLNGTDHQNTLLQLRNVGRTFPMGEVSVEVLKGIDLDVRQSEILAVVGPSGSGKTTILNIIGGLDKPSVGSFTYSGRDMADASAAELTRYRREEVGFVFQF